MENNWKEKCLNLLEIKYGKIDLENKTKNINGNFWKGIIDNMLEFGNLVFEATKKECADKANLKCHCRVDSMQSDTIWDKAQDDYNNYTVNKESILNINKPNL